MKAFLILAVVFAGFFSAAAQTEQAPVIEKDFEYRDWTFKSVADGQDVNLRNWAAGKKMVLVVYFAPWCPNWKHEAPIAQRLYEKYQASGLEVVGVGEYDTVEAMKTSLSFFKITFPVVYESVSDQEKQKTTHYKQRREAGDTRNWGSPWNVFLIPAEFKQKGETLTKKTFVANGELIEADAEKFIREKLGLAPAAQTEAKRDGKTIEACEPDKKQAAFKKP